jgi:lipopolysaccharide transport system ATP-binding protein
VAVSDPTMSDDLTDAEPDPEGEPGRPEAVPAHQRPEIGEPVIVVDEVSKRFRLYKDRPSSLKEMVTRRFRSRFEEFWAVKHASFSIGRGETFGLIGHNGSGKSTLLRLMAGIHPPTEGSISTEGRISALLELGAGFHPDLTGRENIYLNASILGLTRREVDQVLDEIIEFAGLEHFIDSPVKVYSSGMYVRLGFAVAVHVRPEILFIDEVIAVGDEEFQRRCFDYLYRLRRQGVTIVLVSHAHGTLQTICDRVAWLDHGRVLEIGDPASVVKHYLEAVNRHESERLDAEAAAARDAAGPATAPDAEEGRSVEAEATIRLTGVEVLGPEGELTQVAGSGDAMTIRLSYRASGEIVDPTFSLGIAHESGVHVTGTNTVFHEVATGTVKGTGSIDFEIPRLPLLPGTYTVDAAISDKTMMHVFDTRLVEVTLHVQPGSSCERSGMVDLGGRWTLPVPDSDAATGTRRRASG